MKKQLFGLMILNALLCTSLLGCSASKEPSAKQSQEKVVQSLEKECYVQKSTFELLDTAKLASEKKLISCFGNNAGSGYLSPMLPPAPNQDPAPATKMGVYDWPAEEPSEYYDEAGENAPANPYFSPAGWTYKLRQDEAVVILGELPPECKYFSFINYLFSSSVKEGKEYTERSFFKYGNEESGIYHPVFASLGNPVNMNNIKYDGKEAPFGKQFVYIVTGNKDTMQMVKQNFIDNGYPEEMINEAPLPSASLNMGLEKNADTFTILTRVSQPTNKDDYDAWLGELSERVVSYRITPKTEKEENTYVNPEMMPRGTGINEVNLVPDAKQKLDKIREELIKAYSDEYTYEELSSRIAVPEGMTGYQNDENAQGDNRDTSYLMTDDFTLDSDDDFIVVYGLNHTNLGKSTYSNTVLYARPMLNGVTSIYDSMYSGSAEEYLGENDDNFYVIKMARKELDKYTKVIPYSTGNPDGKYYGVDNGDTLLIAYRAYLEPETNVGPSYYEIVYDRAIVFHKKK